MKRAILTSGHDTMEKVYAALAADLAFPAHFSPNLDALWDTLLRDVEGPFEIAWRDAAKAGHKIGPQFKSLLMLFADLAEARGDFSFRRR
jgi:ribonuclease inhibitor